LSTASSSEPVVIFGAGGFIGGTLARGLRRKGHRVIGLTSQDADLADPDSDGLQSLAEELPAGATWVLAAARSPDYPGEPEALKQENIRIARHVLALTKMVRPAGVVLLSSIDVYGREGLNLPLSEDSPRRPQSPYAESKWEAENLATAACSAAGVPLLTLRLPGVYGFGDSHQGPVRSFIDATWRGDDVHVHGDGEQKRDLLYVKDVAPIVRAWMGDKRTAVYNAVTGKSASLNTMLDFIGFYAGASPSVEYHDAPQFDIEFAPPRLLRDYPALKLTRIEDGLREIWERRQRDTQVDTPHVY